MEGNNPDVYENPEKWTSKISELIQESDDLDEIFNEEVKEGVRELSQSDKELYDNIACVVAKKCNDAREYVDLMGRIGVQDRNALPELAKERDENGFYKINPIVQPVFLFMIFSLILPR